MIEEFLVPCPQVISLPGGHVPRPRAIRIELTDADEAVRRDAHRLAEDLLVVAGIEPRFAAGDGLPLRMSLEAAGLKAEGYRLTVAAEGI